MSDELQRNINVNIDFNMNDLNFYKKKCEVLEKDLFKSQTQNKKDNMMIKKLQEMTAMYGKTTNNTSNSFLLPSEFKTNWETLVKDLIMEAFENIFDDNALLAHLVQDTMRVVYEEARRLIKEKIIVVLKCLNILENEGDQKNNPTSTIDKFLIKFRLLFQEYFSLIFNFTEEFSDKVKAEIEKIIKENSNKLSSREKDIKADLDSKGFKSFICSAFKLCIYMLLHEPRLTINIQTHTNRHLCYYYYNKSDFMNIEGFAKENSPCIVILPPPLLRSNFSYQGIKPAVYIVADITDEIKEECEKNKTVTQKGRSYSSSDLMENGVKNNNTGTSATNNAINLTSDVGVDELIAPGKNYNISISLSKNEEKLPVGRDNSNISIKSKILNKENKESINEVGNNVNNTSNIPSLKSSPKPNVGMMKPNSADFFLNSNNNNLNKYIGSNALNNTQNTQSESSTYRGSGTNKADKKTYDHPLNKNAEKNIKNNKSIDNKDKDKDISTTTNCINSNKETYKEIHYNKNNYYDKSANNYNQENLNDQFKAYRSNSHNNVKNPSRNSSILESFNNSMNKDSVRTNDGLYQKSSRTHKNNTPTPNDNSDIDSARGGQDYILSEKLNNISTSFSMIRAKAVNMQYINANIPVSNENINNDPQYVNNAKMKTNANSNKTEKENYMPISNKIKTNVNATPENLIRLQLNSNSKKYNLNMNMNNQPNMNVNINYPLNAGNKTKNPSSLLNSANKVATTPGNYLKNINNNLNVNNMLLKTNYEFGNINKKKNMLDLDKYTTKQEQEKEYKDTQAHNQNQSNILNRNNSQSSDIRIDPQNTSHNSNHTQKSKTMKPGTFVGLRLDNNFINLQNNLQNNIQSSTSPKSAISNHPATATATKKHGHLEYTPIVKESPKNNSNHIYNMSSKNVKNNISNTQSGVLFNGDYEYQYLSLKETNTEGYTSGYNGNTGYRLTHHSGTQINTEGGSSSNRIPTGGNYDHSKDYSNNLMNDMKFNGPKRDEFNIKTSKRDVGLSISSNISSGVTGIINSTQNNSINNTHNKIPDVQFNSSGKENHTQTYTSTYKEKMKAGVINSHTHNIQNFNMSSHTFHKSKK